MLNHNKVSIEDVKSCLTKSGYLMKSRLVKVLSDADFFAEPSVTHPDFQTGKSKEIDLVVESPVVHHHIGACVKTTFLIDAINNNLPIILLTERPSTPNADFESYIKFGYTPDPSPFLQEFSVYEEKSANWQNLFSQICILSRESQDGNLIANCPDDIHSSLLKISEYTEREIDKFQEWTSSQQGKYWRLFFWQPMIVVSGQLMTAKFATNGTLQIQETPLARLEFNWHDGNTRNTTVFEFVREDFLLERLNFIREHDGRIAERMASFISSQK